MPELTDSELHAAKVNYAAALRAELTAAEHRIMELEALVQSQTAQIDALEGSLRALVETVEAVLPSAPKGDGDA